ncbi:hypothetical protein EV426DRAFT_715359 [Tirmania nivea]|nr:hypothetical protein EV426DRAFT_715359 [Tirmania nivea]
MLYSTLLLPTPNLRPCSTLLYPNLPPSPTSHLLQALAQLSLLILIYGPFLFSTVPQWTDSTRLTTLPFPLSTTWPMGSMELMGASAGRWCRV